MNTSYESRKRHLIQVSFSSGEHQHWLLDDGINEEFVCITWTSGVPVFNYATSPEYNKHLLHFRLHHIQARPSLNISTKENQKSSGKQARPDTEIRSNAKVHKDLNLWKSWSINWDFNGCKITLNKDMLPVFYAIISCSRIYYDIDIMNKCLMCWDFSNISWL